MPNSPEARIIVTVVHADDRMLSQSVEVATLTCAPRKLAVSGLSELAANILRQEFARLINKAGGTVLARDATGADWVEVKIDDAE